MLFFHRLFYSVFLKILPYYCPIILIIILFTKQKSIIIIALFTNEMRINNQVITDASTQPSRDDS